MSFKKPFRSHSSCVLAALFSAFFSTQAFAQNTGGIFSPVVNEGHRSFQYRTTLDPDTASGGTGFAQRLHYQQAINGDFMWRILGQTRKTADSDFDFDFLQAELFWDMTKDDKQPFQTGVRFDARLRGAGRAEQIGLNWTNEWNLEEDWQVRAIALSAVQLGDNAANGVLLQTRGHIAKSIGGDKRLGVEMFNNLGSTSDFGSFNKQGHSIGPFVTAPLGNSFSFFGGTLFGISDAAADTELRLWLTKTL